ncbi:MAG: hypothetical protein K8R53_07325 [Bacteroidales bacterium]|nr:hypothetical protein [Bacteroidales bacterium]
MKKFNLQVLFYSLIILFISEVCYAQEYEFEWAKDFGSSNGDCGEGFVVDRFDNIYTTGNFSNSINLGGNILTSYGSTDIYISRIDKSGNILWAVQAGSKSTDSGRTIDCDSSGNIYVAGVIMDTAIFGVDTLFPYGNLDIFISKLDSSGNFLWTKIAGGNDWDIVNTVTLSNTSQILIGGAFFDTINFGNISLATVGESDIFVTCLDEDGDFKWAKSAGGNSFDRGYSLDTDLYSNIYMTGIFRGNANFGSIQLTCEGYDDAFFFKMDPFGNIIWANNIGSFRQDEGYAISIFGNNIFLAGSFCDTIVCGQDTLSTSPAYSDIFMCKLDLDGNIIWGNQAGGIKNDRWPDISIDNHGNTFLSGIYFGTAYFDNFSINSGGSYNSFIAKLNEYGSYLWVKNLESTGSLYTKSLALDSINNLYICGEFTNTALIGNFTMNSSGSWDIFNTKLANVSEEYYIQIILLLQGPYSTPNALMQTNLNPPYLPLSHPYTNAPWFYPGTESVTSIPNPDIVDWILIELRETSGGPETAIPDSTIHRQAAFLLKDGSVVAMDGTGMPLFTGNVTGNLYAVIYHRNHLPVMSSCPVMLNNDTLSWNFATPAGQAYGGTIAQAYLGGGVFGMFAGDGNADGQVGNGDKNDVWVPQAGTAGYLSGDFNMDSDVNNGDKNDLWIPNSGMGSQVPQ